MDTSWKLATLAVALVVVAPLAHADQGTGSRIATITAEMHDEVEAVNQAIAERTADRPNLDEICFRVGNLYQTARHELEESLAEQPALASEATRLAEQLVVDGKSLPSFCGDVEKATQDPGHEAVPRGDIEALRKALMSIAGRAAQLEQAINPRE